MVQCCVKLCKNRSDHQNWKKRNNIKQNNNVKVTFYSFPKDPTTRKLWLDILGMSPSFVVPTATRICSVHFEEREFDRTHLITKLKPNALPSKRLTIQQLSSTISTVTEHSINDDNFVKLESQETDHLSMSTESIAQPSTSKVDRATMVSPTHINNSPEKCRLRKRIKFLKEENAKKMRIAQQKIRRYHNRIITLKSTLNTLKNKQLLN